MKSTPRRVTESQIDEFENLADVKTLHVLERNIPEPINSRDDGEFKGTQTCADGPMRRLTDAVVCTSLSLYISYRNFSKVLQVVRQVSLLDVQIRWKRLNTSLVPFELLLAWLGHRSNAENVSTSLRRSGDAPPAAVPRSPACLECLKHVKL